MQIDSIAELSHNSSSPHAYGRPTDRVSPTLAWCVYLPFTHLRNRSPVCIFLPELDFAHTGQMVMISRSPRSSRIIIHIFHAGEVRVQKGERVWPMSRVKQKQQCGEAS